MEHHAGKRRGFSLIELVITMVLIGLMGVTVVKIISGPVVYYAETVRRGATLHHLNTALHLMEVDILSAAPRSFRASTPVTPAANASFEILHAPFGIRYQTQDFAHAEYLKVQDINEFSGGVSQRFRVLGQIPAQWKQHYAAGGPYGLQVSNLGLYDS
ncbi:MAG: prepilin-type N-terminal cleavage/methylation domain-containing protein, partial [Pseudomonadota bacterium]